MRHDERGTITLWVLGLCIALMFLGGLSLDLWRAVAERRELASMADAVATAAANGVDESALRTGTVHLDSEHARAVADATLAQYPHATRVDDAEVDVARDSVTVTIRGHVRFSLLRIFMGGDDLEIVVHARATPNERP